MIEFSILGAFLALIFIFIYFGFIYQINWIKDLTMDDDKSSSRLAKYKIKKSRMIGKLPPVFPNGWFGILESWELKKGQVKHVTSLGQNFAVFRTESGKVRILDAYCPHMGANMAIDGEVKGDELVCPFHLWRFCGESGACTSIPYSKTVPSSIKTKVWQCYEVNNIIFVWYHAESDLPDWYPDEIEEVNNGTMKCHGRNEFYINCVNQDVTENPSDAGHFEGVHGPSMIPYGFFRDIMHHMWTVISWKTKSSNTEKDDDICVDPNDNITKNIKKHMIEIRMQHTLLIMKKFKLLELDLTVTHTGPGYVVVRIEGIFGPMYIFATITPIRPLIQKVVHTIYGSLIAAPYAKISLISETIMFQRDVEIWNHKKYLDKPAYVSEDKNVKGYRKWFKQFYSANSPTMESLKDQTIEW